MELGQVRQAFLPAPNHGARGGPTLRSISGPFSHLSLLREVAFHQC